MEENKCGRAPDLIQAPLTRQLQLCILPRLTRRQHGLPRGLNGLRCVAHLNFDALFLQARLRFDLIALDTRTRKIRLGGAIVQRQLNCRADDDVARFEIEQILQRLTVAADHIGRDAG